MWGCIVEIILNINSYPLDEATVLFREESPLRFHLEILLIAVRPFPYYLFIIGCIYCLNTMYKNYR